MRLARLVAPLGAALVLFVVGLKAEPQTPAATRPPAATACAGRALCTETLSFAAAVTDFQALLQNQSTKIVTVRLSITNKLTRPLILGYVNGSGVVTDDRGNRYMPSGERATTRNRLMPPALPPEITSFIFQRES